MVVIHLWVTCFLSTGMCGRGILLISSIVLIINHLYVLVLVVKMRGQGTDYMGMTLYIAFYV